MKDFTDPVGDLQKTATGLVQQLTVEVNKYIAAEVAELQQQVAFLQKTAQELVLSKTKAVERAAKRASGVINKYL